MLKDDFVLPPDSETWLRCDNCINQCKEEWVEICERCNKVFCFVCSREDGYFDALGEIFGGGTGYICAKCEAIIDQAHSVSSTPNL
jgi:hypothetical protein